MKNFSKIILSLPLLVLAACDYSQPAAKVEYHLEDYYGYGDVQGPPSKGSAQDIAMRNKGVPVQIEDVSKDNIIGPEVQVEDIAAPKGTQVYTVSDKIGPESNGKATIVRNAVTSDTSEVNISQKTHTVAKGETLFSISRQYDIPILPIIVANGLEAPYALTEGQQLKLPEGKFHVVKDGETLYSISRQYGVDMSGIVKLNGLKMPYNVVKDQKLQIPFPSDLPSESNVAEASDSGESLTETNIKQEKESNRFATAETAEDKSKPASLRRPTGGVLGAYNVEQKPEATPEETKQVAESETKPQPAIDTEKENEKLAAKTTETIRSTASDTGGDGFMWPVQGKVVKKFGNQGGEYNDGINIAASAGTEVKASNSGRVVFTGNSLKSYGNLVIIKHDNGLLSAYAHLNNVNVKKDQQISKGQVVGTVGSTGKVTSPQLYFAIRKGKDAKDPMKYLR